MDRKRSIYARARYDLGGFVITFVIMVISFYDRGVFVIILVIMVI